MPAVVLVLAAALAVLGACAGPAGRSGAPAAVADTVVVDTARYPSAAATVGVRFEAVRDLDAPGAAPIGTSEAEILARYGAPDRETELDVVGRSNLYERRIEVLNVVADWARRGEAVRARELWWDLPNEWKRTVWLVDGGGVWTSAGGMEWASDRVEF